MAKQESAEEKAHRERKEAYLKNCTFETPPPKTEEKKKEDAK
jgi:hypothetical protein